METVTVSQASKHTLSMWNELIFASKTATDESWPAERQCVLKKYGIEDEWSWLVLDEDAEAPSKAVLELVVDNTGEDARTLH